MYKITDVDTLNLVKTIALCLKTPEQVRKAVLASARSQPNTGLNQWHSLSISHGYPALVLLFSVLDKLFPLEEWDLISHQYVLSIKASIEAGELNDLSMFGGLAGCCFAIHFAARDNKRYQKLLTSLNGYLFTNVKKQYLEPIRKHINLKEPINPSLYDVISGITGIGVYALANRHLEDAENCLKNILEICIAITDDIILGSYKVRGWYVPSDYQFTEIDKKNYSEGNFNMGLAHGVTGILAFLSIAAIKGVLMPNQLEAIQKINSWMYSRKKEKDGVPYWDYTISFQEEVLNQTAHNKQLPADGWCYGSAGVLRSLHLAAKALRSFDFEKQALEHFLFMPQRIEISPYLTSSFCHGVAGALTITSLMARDTLSFDLAKQAAICKRVLLESGAFRDALRFENFQINHSGENKARCSLQLENVGLLEGITGILLSIIGHETGEFSWACPLLLEYGS